jgi:hypothetical protein
MRHIDLAPLGILRIQAGQLREINRGSGAYAICQDAAQAIDGVIEQIERQVQDAARASEWEA